MYQGWDSGSEKGVQFDEAKCCAHNRNPTCWLPMLTANIPAVYVAAQLDQTDRSHRKFDSTKGYPRALVYRLLGRKRRRSKSLKPQVIENLNWKLPRMTTAPLFWVQ
jgi:hypothetical protein